MINMRTNKEMSNQQTYMSREIYKYSEKIYIWLNMWGKENE